jgi:hypothetical protein
VSAHMVTTRSRITAPLLALTVAASIWQEGRPESCRYSPTERGRLGHARRSPSTRAAPALRAAPVPRSHLPRFSTSIRSPPALVRLSRTRNEPNAARTQERR